jgi:hypothetical protein
VIGLFGGELGRRLRGKRDFGETLGETLEDTLEETLERLWRDFWEGFGAETFGETLGGLGEPRDPDATLELQIVCAASSFAARAACCP